MGLIDIVDDRDVTYNQTGTFSTPIKIDDTARFKQIEQQLQNEFSAGAVTHLGEGFFHLELGIITCTGSDIEQYLSIPFRHRIYQFVMKHTDSSDVDSTDSLDYTLKYGLGQIKPNLLLSLLSKSSSAVSDAIHLFPNFWRRQTRYKLITNSTNTDRLYASFVIEVE